MGNLLVAQPETKGGSVSSYGCTKCTLCPANASCDGPLTSSGRRIRYLGSNSYPSPPFAFDRISSGHRIPRSDLRPVVVLCKSPSGGPTAPQRSEHRRSLQRCSAHGSLGSATVVELSDAGRSSASCSTARSSAYRRRKEKAFRGTASAAASPADGRGCSELQRRPQW